jgi:hypothetical protein
MTRQPLHARIDAALRLQPMTESELARCLSVTQQSISGCLAKQPVRPVGWRKRGRYAAIVWGRAA